MVATGTGIGPFLAILKSDEVWQKFEKVILCYSVSYAEELAYTDLIAEISQRYPQQFCFVPIVTREKFGAGLGYRLPTVMRDGSLEQFTGLEISERNSHVMMCGSSDMITDVSTALQERGMKKHRRRDPGHYTTEKYH
jgi:ferredoxin--NADP+ reductase